MQAVSAAGSFHLDSGGTEIIVPRANAGGSGAGQHATSMTDIIVSYDGTPNDDDALALGRMLARAGATLALAYVRHSREFEPQREALAAHDAQRRLQQGAAWLGDAAIPQHVVVSPSTWEGLAQLAAEIGSRVIVFGSDYRTPPGTVVPGTSAQHLLESGPVAVGVAPAGIRTRAETAIRTIAVADEAEDPAALQTARSLAQRLGAELAGDVRQADLIMVGSAAGTRPGRVRLTSAARNRLAMARAAVLVVPAGVPVLS